MKQLIDRGWKFHLGDVADAGSMMYDDRGWREVNLPHDWAVEHPFDRAYSSGTGYLPGGIAWYRKPFCLTEADVKGRIRIYFQGVYKHARVWINSHYLGQHACGYTSFSFDLTEFVRPGENLIAVRVEHEETADSRWYTGSGITRHVLLEKTGSVCFETNGIFVSTVDANPEKSTLRISYETLGAEEVLFRLLDKEGAEIARVNEKGEKGEAFLKVSAPTLWSPEHPSLYTLHGETKSMGNVTDHFIIPVGIRTFRFDPDAGFFLNEVPMKIKGVCVHHDAGCLGAAVPKTVWKRRILKLKEMGCNALRTAHNPPDPDLLDLCDELGLLVMDEAFDEWEGIKNKWWQGHNVYPPKHFGYGEDFPQWHELDLESMICRDRNHPSIILWSIGNEIDYPCDPYVTPLFREAMGNNDANKPLAERLYDIRKPDASRLTTVAKKLVDQVHRLDRTRPVLSALSFPELSTRTGFADVLDMVGYNYREHFYEADHAKWPDRVILGSENGHDPAMWRAVTEHPYIAGQFLWTGIDFLGECPGWPVRISRAGALDLAGMEKPQYAQRRALWTEAPYARIAVGMTDEDRGAWGECFRWEGEPGERKRVSLYTNQPEAELFLNGRTLGRQAVSDENGRRAIWEIQYEPGELKGKAGEAEDRLVTPGTGGSLSIEPALKEPVCCGEVIQLTIMIRDEQGLPALDQVIHCQPFGDLELLGMENGLPDDLTPYSEPKRITKEGRLIAYFRVGNCAGDAGIHLWTAEGLRTDLSVRIQGAG